MRCSAHQRPRSAHSAGSGQPPNSSRTRARVFLTRDRRVIGLRREVVTAAEEDRTGGAGRGAAARDPHFANAAGASGPRGRAVGSGRGRMGAGPRGPRGALRTPASAGFRHARPSTVSRLPVCTSVLPRHARAGHAALAACRGHAGRRWRARRARLSPECASSRSLLRTATGRVRVSVGSVSLSVRAPTHVRVHTHVQMRPCAPFPRTCLGPAAGAGRAAPPLPCTPHCSPGMRRPRGAGLACRHSDGLTWRCSSRPPALCSRRLTRVSSQPPKRPKNA